MSQVDNSLVLKSQVPIRGIDFNPVQETRTYFHYTYKEGKRTKVNPKAINWWHTSVQHMRIHDSITCELCSNLRHFIKSTFVTAGRAVGHT